MSILSKINLFPLTRKFLKRKYCTSGSKELQNLLEILDDGRLVHCGGERVRASKVFQNKKIIAYYFSAAWCTPCKMLLPIIKSIYKENKTRKLGLEIIFISSDVDEETMLRYFKERHGGWYAVPYTDTAGEILRQMYAVTFIPQIIVVTIDGVVISREGTKDIELMRENVLTAWNPTSF